MTLTTAKAVVNACASQSPAADQVPSRAATPNAITRKGYLGYR